MQATLLLCTSIALICFEFDIDQSIELNEEFVRKLNAIDAQNQLQAKSKK